MVDSALLALEDPFLKIQTLVETAAAKLSTLVRITRLPSDRMEAWMMAAQQHHVSPAEITAAIESIQAAAEHGRADIGNSKPWEQLGISPDQDPLDVLDQMHACASTFAPAIVRPILAGAGIGDHVFHLFRQEKPGFHGIDGSDRDRASTSFPVRVSEFAQKLAATTRGASSRLSGILSGFRDAAAASLHIGDFTDAWAGSVQGNALAEKNLAWIYDSLQGAAEPVGTAMQLASSLVEDAGKNGIGKLMDWIAPGNGQDLTGSISPAFLAQPTLALAQRVVADEAAAPNTTVNVNQYIEGSVSPQKAAEDAIRRMIEMTAAQLPSESY
ncbi:hypothetical protein CKA38_14570 [Ereboglobus luteus]|uniref:Uncharacterized protein n=2 Tax=Ereboglobus luteus TaxID=1796921 RepID=A0A2U8E6V8_9BACT|nr:hypothetical protein CKA38_14570 [Ereboglobus luteus]